MIDPAYRPHSWPLLATLAVLCACSHSARDDGFVAGAGGESSGDPTTGGEAESSSSSDPLLDAGTPDDPTTECASITQSTSIESLPSDIILVPPGGPGSALDFRNEIAALREYIHAEGVADGQAVFLVTGEPPPDEKLFPGCESWVCCWGEGECSPEQNASLIPSTVVEAAVHEERPLADLIATSDLWAPALRPAARKHVWFIAPDNRDATMSAEAFTTAFEDLGDSFSNFTAHAMIGGDPSVIDPSGGELGALVAKTGGVYYDPTDGNYWAPTFFGAVLDGINKTALLCSYDIPTPPDEQVFDKEKVNVDYDAGDGLKTVGYVSSLSECAEVGAGWYYDDEESPTEILMCPFTCDRFKTADDATIEIRFGCATVPAG